MAPELCSPEVIRYYPPSRTAIPDPKVGTHALLPLTPVPPLLGFPRLACLIHAANVRSEPGSNPSKCIEKPPEGGPVFECLSQPYQPARLKELDQSAAAQVPRRSNQVPIQPTVRPDPKPGHHFDSTPELSKIKVPSLGRFQPLLDTLVRES